MVDFAGWDMPLHYGSQVEEHHVVRRSVGVFDVSHMSVFDLEGAESGAFLRMVAASNVAHLKQVGQAIYSCILNEQAGIIDDLIVYYLDEGSYRIVSNAATHEKVLTWLRRHADGFSVQIFDRDDLGLLAVQGPLAKERTLPLLSTSLQDIAGGLRPFHACWQDDIFVARTGYTGEDGYELIAPSSTLTEVWDQLSETGVQPCGLGARDTLRLEAGMNLNGMDMDESTTPLECGLAWTVAWEPSEWEFIGHTALRKMLDEGPSRCRMGLVLDAKGVLRAGQIVLLDGEQAGITTSGGFSPTLGVGIALARLPRIIEGAVCVDVRGRQLPVRVVRPPFVRHGKNVYRSL